MGSYIVQMADNEGQRWYFIWSDSTDSPVTAAMSATELLEWYREEYGAAGMRQLPERMARANHKGAERNAHRQDHRHGKYQGAA